jgi:putative ABC transport system permease protein
MVNGECKDSELKTKNPELINMLKTYFKIAWRNLQKNKSYASINILGLSLGIACAILIFTVVTYHLSFDSFHNNKDRIYRVVTEWHEDAIDYSPGVPTPLGKTFRNNYTLAEKTARIIEYHNTLITIPDQQQPRKFRETDGIAFTEPDFFDIFSFPLIKGNKTTALASPNSAIVTEKIAQKYFGTTEAIGKTIRLENKIDFVITGILKDFPSNTDQQQQIFLSYTNLKDHSAKQADDNIWDNVYGGSRCFVFLKPGIDATTANNALSQLVTKTYSGRDVSVWKFKLQPLSDIHFNQLFDGYIDKKYLWALLFVGLFLVITACVNFINLATAQALNRSKEIGVRKVLGSIRTQLFWQFIVETAVITLFAVMLAYGMAYLALPWLNGLLQAKMLLSLFNNIQLTGFLLLLTLVVIFLSGSYPALILARFKPILALKNKVSQKHIGGFSLRRILVITQFAISQILIIGAIVIASQMRYTKTADLGFNKNAIVMLPVPIQDNTKMSALRNRLAAISGVEKVSFCYQAPAAGANSTRELRYNNRTEAEHWDINLKFADDQYLSTFDIKLVAGRNFYPSDTLREYLVNETFVKKLNLSPQEVIGKTLSVGESNFAAPIAGVVKDFYNYSFHTEIDPVCIMPGYQRYSNCAVKMNSKNIPSTLAAFEKVWNDTYPDYLYSHTFLDDRIARFYEIDTIMYTLVKLFAFIAIFIGCLGLYGLVSFMAIRKTKEIGVRKVLGASVQHILWLFGKEFTRLLLIAFVIAAPFAWWLMHLYLQDFKYRIKIGAEIFLLAILATFVVACITVGYRSLRSALTSPVRALRSE